MSGLSGLLLVVAAALAFSVAAYFGVSADWTSVRPTSILFLFAFPVACGVGLLAALRLGPRPRAVVVVNLVAVGVAVYGADLYIQLTPPERVSVQEYAAELGKSFDPRTPREFARDLKTEQGPVYPAASGTSILKPDKIGNLHSLLRLDGKELLPLAGLANRPAIFCNETGQWVWYRADEQGFNNPPGLWAGPADILSVGDSFTHGFCVPAGANMIDRIREKMPRTLNAGISGAGPLTMLAVLREFGPVTRPRTVLWFFYSNDVTDLEREKLSPLLMRYLKPNSTRLQDLYRQKARVDEILRPFYAAQMDKIQQAESARRVEIAFRDLALLRNLRKALGVDIGGSRFDYALLERTLLAAKNAVAGWQGELIFVYLPGYPLFGDDRTTARYARAIHTELRGIVGRLKIGWIDLTPAFAARPDPRSLFDKPNLHYSRAGYGLAAGVVLEALGPQR